MPRTARLDAPGSIHHVWARGIEGRALFQLADHRRDFFERLSRILPESGIRCLAYALMSNHFHLIVETGATPLSHAMRRLHTGFAMRFNGREGRIGYLFQGRFGSRPLSDDGDLLRTMAYVLRNPLTAGAVHDVRELARSPACSLGSLLGRRTPLAFETPGRALDLLGPDPGRARQRLMEALARSPAPGDPLGALIADVCREIGADPEALRRGARDRRTSEARGRISRLALTELRMRPSAIAPALGVGPSAVCQAAHRRS